MIALGRLLPNRTAARAALAAFATDAGRAGGAYGTLLQGWADDLSATV